MDHLSLAWGTAIAAVVVHTVGIWNLVTLVLSLTTVAVSFCLTLYWRHGRAADEYSVQTCRSRLPLPSPGIPAIVSLTRLGSDIPRSPADRIVSLTRSPPRELRFDQRYTGSSPIDEQIKQVLQFAFRDFVKPW
ncbi:uncharacterized protein LOC119097255 [Pollicipes pollicipes]|uniref:uncharacterized protein LOC119097255 n=1 Tax=Pollicipes pollicipes TaxID=41117 RepID=UPI001885405E|nr:uncharacterized protein LOC119097255 [Pollicipes pollicipes]